MLCMELYVDELLVTNSSFQLWIKLLCCSNGVMVVPEKHVTLVYGFSCCDSGYCIE